MGIRGLTTFIAHRSDRYLEDYKLKDCHLVIDGNSLAAQLYLNKSSINCAFGGDYDRYAASVVEFFVLLKKCRVQPLVVFDGGYEKHKLKTTYQRLKQKWLQAKDITPATHFTNRTFPCLMRDTFKDVLRTLKVPFAQSLFEADEEIAAIARVLNCPVLSYDSDFFVYDVLYIPFPTLYLHLCKEESNQASDVTFYLSCSLYRVENFLKHYGGLEKELLPLLAVLLGNDYIQNGVLTSFVSHLRRPKSQVMHRKQRKIAGLLGWLQRETLESATSKVMGFVRKKKRGSIAARVKRIIYLYLECSSELLPVLGIKDIPVHSEPSGDARKLKSLLEEQDTSVEGQEIDTEKCSRGDGENEGMYEVENSNSSEEDREEEDDEYSSEVCESEEEDVTESECLGKDTRSHFNFELEKASCLPAWFLDSFKRGELPPPLMDMYILNSYFAVPQVEDYTYPSSHSVSLHLISVLYGLLVSGNTRNFLRCYIRKLEHSSLYKIVNPVCETASIKFPSLEDLPKLPTCQRLQILIEAAGLSSIYNETLSHFPLPWQLYLIAVIYWARSTEQQLVNVSHIDALLLSLLLLDVVNKNVECTGSKRKSRKRDKNVVKKANLSVHHTVFGLVPPVGGMSGGHSTSDLQNNVENEISKTNYQVQPGGLSVGIEAITAETKEKSLMDIEQTKTIDCNITKLDVCTALETVSLEECVSLRNAMRSFSVIDEKMKTRPRLFCVTTVHSFSQFQSCLQHLIYLNSLLGYPLPHCISYHVFSGTFVYNIYNRLKRRTDALSYISQLFETAPSVFTLYKILREEIGNLIPEVHSTNHAKQKTCKKKHSSKTKNENSEKSEEKHNQCADSDFDDPSNRFAALRIAD